MAIHPTAIVDRTAEIDPTAEVGAYAIVERDVRIGPRVRLYPHAYVGEGTTLGADCEVHPFAVVGHPPQDLKFKGEPTFTVVGGGTIIREHATIHRGTMPGSTTVVGARCFIMSTGHIGHNCTVGDDVVIANGGLLAGHVSVGHRAFISGNAVVHQFSRLGELVMVAGGTRLVQDVPPYMLYGPRGVHAPNVVGLRRAGLGSTERHELRQCHRLLYRSGLRLPDAIERIAGLVQTEPGRKLLAFLREPSKRGLATLRRPHAVMAADDDE